MLEPFDDEGRGLAFVGDFEEARLADLCAAAKRAASAVKPFELRFAGVGAFPKPESPRVVFLGSTDEPKGSISKLHDLLEAELVDMGLPRDGQRFKPHLTLARVRAQDKIGELTEVISRFNDFEAGVSLVEEMSVYLSELTSSGPVYTRACRVDLCG